MTKSLGILAISLLWVGSAHGDWFTEIEIGAEKEVDGQRDFTVKFTPGITHQCDQVVLECIYHQEFPWTNARGKKYTKVHEPVRFSYRRHAVKFVNDLDVYISFRAPVSMKRLQRIYGPKVFNEDHAVTIARMRLRGIRGEKELWAFELRPGMKHGAETLAQGGKPEE